MLQPYVTPAPLLLIFAAHLAALVAMIIVLRTPHTGQAGWRNVEPGALHWLGFLGGWALAALVSWVWLFVGSARANAETQMNWALGLAVVFGLSAAVSGFHLAGRRRAGLRWRGTTARWTAASVEHEQDLRHVDAIRRVWTGSLEIRFKDGQQLSLDMQLTNATELLAAISEAIGRDAW